MTADLYARTRLATAQVTALQGRVDAINGAIDGDCALPEEGEESPSRGDVGRMEKVPGFSRPRDRSADLAISASVAGAARTLQRRDHYRPGVSRTDSTQQQ